MNKEEVSKWIAFANEDLTMAKFALEAKIYNQVCFHCQQCIEKTIKGFITYQGKVHPQTHRLVDLLSFISPSPFDDLRSEIIIIGRFYTPVRYPDVLPGALPEGLPGEKDAKEAIEVAKLVLEKAKEEMKIS
jgi:HEPN domain-containing protein